jgi:NAD(P)-dependent dehydrogenase (short-subunit alcohol dehydrogenase family)
LAEADEFVAKLRAGGARACAMSCDLADFDATAALLPTAARVLGPITLLVNNASVFEDDTAANFDRGSFDRHIAVNLRAPAQLVSLLAAALPANRDGCAINVIDQRVWRLTPEFFSYTLAKSALWTATRTLAQTFAPRLRVNAVGPGPTLPNETEGESGFAREVAEAPLRRAVAPAEIAEAVVFLAKARGVTGQMIAVDAGQHLAWGSGRLDVG